MGEIKVGDTVVLTDKVPPSEVYPFAVEGAEGVVEFIFKDARDYPYQVMFPGNQVIDPRGCASIVRDPALLFERDEIELKGGK